MLKICSLVVCISFAAPSCRLFQSQTSSPHSPVFILSPLSNSLRIFQDIRGKNGSLISSHMLLDMNTIQEMSPGHMQCFIHVGYRHTVQIIPFITVAPLKFFHFPTKQNPFSITTHVDQPLCGPKRAEEEKRRWKMIQPEGPRGYDVNTYLLGRLI